MILLILAMGCVLRSISDIEKYVPRYILKNTPRGLPVVGKFYNAFIQALLKSSMINDALDELDLYTSADPDPEAECLNFILKDYCSVVGVTYEPRYKEAVLRALVRKDEEFFKWFSETYFGGAVVTTPHGGYFEEGVYTTDVDEVTTDSDLYTDMIVRSQAVLTFDINETEDIAKQYIMGAIDLLYLVLPARTHAMFKFIEEA